MQAPRKDYTTEQMAKAIEEVRKGEKISVAATRYGVPRITLHNKITGKSPVDCNLGPATVLSHEEENILVRWVCFMAAKHFPVTKEQLLDSVQKIISEKKLDSCPFTNNRPGKKWYSLFLKRHPDLSERTAQNLSKAREEVTEDDILRWFDVIKSYLENKGLLEVINDPERIFNSDESAFYLQPKAGRVLVRKGEKNVYTSSGDEKENLTVLVTGNAAGVLAPPMIVYPYEHLSLYTIWAKTKDYLNENLPQKVAATITEQVSHSSEPEHVTESESLPPQTPEAFVADNSISTLPEHVLDVSDHISDKPLITKNLQGRYFGPSTSQVCTDTNASDSGNPDLQEEDIGRPESVLELSKTVSKDIAQQAMRTTPNKVFTPETNDTIAQSLSSSSQNIIEENIEPVTESTKTISKDIACSAIYSTPNKVHNSELNNTISKPMPSKPQNVMDENIPSPFKRALLWPEPEMKKRRSKERLPSAITGETWRAYMIKKENEKKQKEEEKNKRMKERQEKQLIKKKTSEEREKVKNKKKITKTVSNKRKRIESSSSSAEENDIPYQESDQDLELSEDDQINCPKLTTESLESDENIPLKDLSLQSLKKNTYVIIKYEGGGY
ncbi:hypothetical protein SFRURICE_015532 [Spodoptera frugiperda]|nr:hypothetical protein SFRURICE_015532 [Spodoptera frugiperda]